MRKGTTHRRPAKPRQGQAAVKADRLLKIPEICAILGCGRSFLYDIYIVPGRLKMTHLSPAAVRALESRVVKLRDEIVAKSDAK
jgi:predicted DNA-binding transcriptional regulator AlpA